MLCSLAQFKARAGIAVTTDDTAIAAMIAGVSGLLAGPRGAGRIANGVPCLELLSLTQLFTIDQLRTQRLYVSAWPIVSVTSVKEALFNQFSSVAAMTENTDYYVNYERGIITRIAWFLVGYDSVQVVYRGGYTRADDWSDTTYALADKVLYGGSIYQCASAITVATGKTPDTDIYAAGPPASGHWTLTLEIPLPADIQEACVEQSIYAWRRRGILGTASQGVGGASSSDQAKDDLLPTVEAVMRGYRRIPV